MRAETITSITAIIALALAAMSLGYTARQTRLASNSNLFTVLEAVRSKLAARVPEAQPGEENSLIALRHKFSGDENEFARNPSSSRSGYERALIARIRIVHTLREDMRREDFRHVKRLVDAYNYVAEKIDSRLFDATPTLGTYHIAIIRELFIAEPYIWHRMLFERPGRWGMRALRLGEMARSYNEMNPIHRRDVIFDGDKPYGTILPKTKPRKLRRAWWWIHVRVVGYPTITPRSKVAQNRLAERLADALDAPYPEDRHKQTRRAR
jgi:hypothetical protein